MARLMVSVIASIIGYVDDTLIYEVTLIIMDKITDDEKGFKFYYVRFLAHALSISIIQIIEII
jgi:hypothetical protein